MPFSFSAYRREFLAGLACLVLAVVLGLVAGYTPRPSIADVPSSTKDSTVQIKGTASPKRGVVLFDAAGNALLTVNADDKGAFSFASVPVNEGKTVYTLRAFTAGLRSSFPRTVAIVKDTTAPELSINALQNASVTGVNTVISGKAEAGVTVTINGVQASVQKDGSWSATIALQAGKNTMSVSATDTAGNTTTHTQTIEYIPTAVGSPTGIAQATATQVMYSAGSNPPTIPSAAAPAPAAPAAPTTTAPAVVAPAPVAPAIKPTPAPAPVVKPAPAPVIVKPATSIVVSARVSNASPRSSSTIMVSGTVRDNYNRPVTGATVIAMVHYRIGTQAYTLKHVGNGVYSYSFKMGSRYSPGYRVSVDVTAHSGKFVHTGYTAFTPL